MVAWQTLEWKAAPTVHYVQVVPIYTDIHSNNENRSQLCKIEISSIAVNSYSEVQWPANVTEAVDHVTEAVDHVTTTIPAEYLLETSATGYIQWTTH